VKHADGWWLYLKKNALIVTIGHLLRGVRKMIRRKITDIVVLLLRVLNVKSGEAAISIAVLAILLGSMATPTLASIGKIDEKSHKDLKEYLTDKLTHLTQKA
jgi:hypothetical protein